MKLVRNAISAIAAVATLGLGGVMPMSAAADTGADNMKMATVTPNPWYVNGPFEGWGTSLAWLANATGNYGEDGSVTRYAGDSSDDAAKTAAESNAQEYGKQLREQFYESIFGENGLDLNMARYNIGGGNASDVAYGYPFMRQGAAVPGYWAQDADGSLGIYGGVGTKQADKDDLDAAFDANSDSSYVWSGKNADTDASKAVKAQEWWLKRGAQDGDITHVEAFANSAPWFMTQSGYVTGGTDASDNNLKDPVKFAQYLAQVVAHLNTLKAENGKSVHIDTVDPLNESETSYWGTPSGKASDYSNSELVNRYWQRYYAGTGKNKSVTPYYDGVKKPQEGMHVGNATAQQTISALRTALDGNRLGSVKVSATDATDSGQFVDSYNQFSQQVRDAIGQYNTHSYGTNRQRVARDIAQSDNKPMSMSEVDGSWQSGGFNPYGFDNALGMAGKINSDVYALQSNDFTFWQVVEDLYNMSTGTKDINGNTANPQGENTNWGTVLIDFDCTVAGTDGKLYSERDVDNNGGKTDGIKPCSVVVNSKYNAVRAYTHFIHEGDGIIANNSTADNMTATSADGKTQTVIHRNSNAQAEKFVIDLSKYATIAPDASGKLYLTTAPDKKDDTYAATLDYMNQYSNQEQSKNSVVIDAKAKTATLTIPAHSIASIQLSGVSGVADGASIEDGQAYQLIGQDSGKALQVAGDGSLTIENAATDSASGDAQSLRLHEVVADPGRPTLRRYVVSSADNSKVLDDTGKFVVQTVDSARKDAKFIWILNTDDGDHYSLVNASAKEALDVSGGSTAAGTSVGLWQSNGGDNQAWTIRSTSPTGVASINVQASIGSDACKALPKTVTPYYTWGTGAPVAATWDSAVIDTSNPGSHVVKGSAKDVFGNEFTFVANLYVGEFTVTDPVSVTVVQGISADLVKQSLQNATVHAHVGASEAVAVDPSSVSWNLDDALSDFSTAVAGGKIAVSGSLRRADGSQIPVKGTIFVSSATQTNIADSSTSSLNVNVQEGSSSSKAVDGDTSSKGWSTWNQGTVNPVATFSFASPQSVSEVKTYFYRDGRASWPKQQKLEYLDLSGQWHEIGVKDGATEGWVLQKSKDVDPSVEGDAPIADFVLDKPVVADGIRLTNILQDTGVYINVAEMQIFANALDGSAVATPANVATLGDIRIDGKQIADFEPDKTSYTVDLPYDAEANPVLQAYATDNAANVSVEWSRDDVSKDELNAPDIGGTATITVTSADGTKTQTTTVVVARTGSLTSLDVVPPTKTTYAIGDSFDTSGMSVSAIYSLKEGGTRRTTIPLVDPQLSISGFASTTAGKKTITVSYRGVSATFDITVQSNGNQNGGNPPSENGTGTAPANPGSQQIKPAGTYGKNPSERTGQRLSATGTTMSTLVVVALGLFMAGILCIVRRQSANR